MRKQKQRRNLTGPPEPEVLLEMIRQLLNDPKIVEAMAYAHVGEDEIRELHGELIALAEDELVAQRLPPAEVTEDLLRAVVGNFLAVELLRECAARDWTVAQGYGHKERMELTLCIEELDTHISTAGAVAEMLYLDYRLGQEPTPDQLDYSLFTPCRFLAKGRRVPKDKLAAQEIG